MPGSGFRGDASEVARITRTTTDASGVWSVALERNADISPSGTYYQVVEKIPFAERKYNIQVGSTSQTLFAALITTPPSIPATAYLTQAAGDARYVLAPGSFGGAVDMSPVAYGDTADAGTEDAYARIDHRHAFTDNSYVVCTSGTRPGSPTKGDTIYETDTGLLLVYYGATTGWQRPWGMPWGHIASDESPTSDQGSITTLTDITGVSVTFTAVASRYYKVTLWVPSIFQVTGGAITLQIANSANTNQKQSLINPTGVSNVNTAPHVLHFGTFSAGSLTLKGRVSASSAATLDHAAGQTTLLLVEDCGPASTVPSA